MVAERRAAVSFAGKAESPRVARIRAKPYVMSARFNGLLILPHERHVSPPARWW